MSATIFLHHSSTLQLLIITGGDGVAPGLVHGLHHGLVPEDQPQPRHQLSLAAITQDVNTWHLTVRRESHGITRHRAWVLINVILIGCE